MLSWTAGTVRLLAAPNSLQRGPGCPASPACAAPHGACCPLCLRMRHVRALTTPRHPVRPSTVSSTGGASNTLATHATAASVGAWHCRRAGGARRARRGSAGTARSLDSWAGAGSGTGIRRAGDSAALNTVASRAAGGTQPRQAGADPAGAAEPAAATAATGATQHSSSSGPEPGVQEALPLLADSTFMRRVTSAGSAGEALDILLQRAEEVRGAGAGVREAECCHLLLACLERGNTALALDMYAAMRSTGAAGGNGTAGRWPAVGLETVTALLLGLARAVRLSDALQVVADVRRRGMPRGDEVPFGTVVGSPLAAGQPLAVVQPQEGSKLVVCAASRYEFELFSGRVVDSKSEALAAANASWLLIAARAAGLWRRPPAAAVHSMDVQAPDGRARTFRFATSTADVPAQVGERVTVICAPSKGRSTRTRLLGTGPPGAKPGEPLAVHNHATGATSAVGPPPAASAGIPAWMLPAAVILAGSDAASALIDPALPALLAAGLGAAAVSGVVGSTVVLPRLKQLPEASVRVEGQRQRLLRQRQQLLKRCDEVTGEAEADVRALARLWQLAAKMGAVGTAGAYDARLDRVSQARQQLEEGLQRKLALIDGYARVMNMIEIEVEMETEVTTAEVAGIEEQIARLADLAALQEEWSFQAEAQDEVERLLRQA